MTDRIELDTSRLADELHTLAKAMMSLANRELADLLVDSLNGMVDIAVRGKDDVGGYAAMAAALAEALADGLECIGTYLPSVELDKHKSAVIIPVFSEKERGENQ